MSGSRLRMLTGMTAVIAVAGCGALTGPSPVDANWRVHQTAHFVLHVRPGSFADQHVSMIGEVLDEQYASSVATLEGEYAGTISGFFYDTVAEGGFDAPLSGVAFGLTESFKAVVEPPFDDSLLSLLAHEANHVIVRHVLGRHGTAFASEGLASALVSERYHELGPTFLHQWAAQAGALPSLAELIDEERWEQTDSNIAYRTSGSFLAYLLQTYGPVPLKQVYGAPASAFAGRFRDVYGLTLDQAERDWQAFLGRPAGWPATRSSGR